MIDIKIPDKALKDAARAIAAEVRVVTESDVRAFELTPREYAELARAACLAMLKAWPGVWHIKPIEFEGKIILPLTQEKTDAK